MTTNQLMDAVRTDDEIKAFAGMIAERIEPRVKTAIADAIEVHAAACMAKGIAAQPTTFRAAAIAAVSRCPIAVAIIAAAIILREGIPALAHWLGMPLI